MASQRLQEAQTAFSEQRYEDALAIVQELHDAKKISARSLRVKYDSYVKMGELHKALGELNRLRHVKDGPRLDAAARRLLGRIIETDTDWLPSTAERHRPIEANDSPNKILHLLKESLPYSETGFTFRSRMTLTAQRIAGFSPEVITSMGFPRSKGVHKYRPLEIVDEVPHHRIDPGDDIDVARLPADVSLNLNTELACQVVDGVRPHLVQAGTGFKGFDTALMGIALAERYDLPFVYEVRGFQESTWTSDIERSERGEYYRRRIRQENRCMRRADHVITIAHSMSAEIVNRGVGEDRVSVVPNAVDTERFTPRPKSEQLLEKYRLSEDRFVLGYISNLGFREGIEHLIQAIGILRSRSRDAVALIVGDGPERPVLESLVNSLDLGDRVVLTGHIPNEEIVDHYALIDLFVVPRIEDRASRFVTPLKPLEAMAMRLPVIVSALPALEELVQPGTRGLSFPPSDPVAIADLSEQIMEDDDLRDRLAEEGLTWVRQERTLASNARRYSRILRPLLNGSENDFL